MSALKRIKSAEDPLWDFWLSVYYRSFPENERMTLGFLASQLPGDSQNDLAKAPVIGVYEWNNQPAGIAYYVPHLENRLVELWYLAVAPEKRGEGVGSALFSHVIQVTTLLKASLLVWEVETPNPNDPIPERRIKWYQGLGAKKLEGIRYHQSTDRPLPPVSMALMVYFLSEQEADAEAVFGQLKANYEDNLEQDGILHLV